MTRLSDPVGRTIRKLRLQLLDACNQRCFYCMPDKVSFLPRQALLDAAEIARIAAVLHEQGVTRLRLTGGEPTLRIDFDDVVTRLAAIPFERKGMTTNALRLSAKLPLLRRLDYRFLNISVDSLRADRYARITRVDALPVVLRALREARDAGFVVKVNTVVCRGVNDDELADFAAFAAAEAIPVRFLELLKIGPGAHLHPTHFMPASEMRTRLASVVSLERELGAFDETSQNYRTGAGGRVGFIASESEPFCGNCSRLRLTATGTLRACLMSEAGTNLRGLSADDIRAALPGVLARKPTGRIERIEQPMHQIGG